jgi:hypothetical protein
LISPHEHVQVARRARRTVSGDRVRADDQEIAALFSQAANEVDEVLGDRRRHRWARIKRPGMAARA